MVTIFHTEVFEVLEESSSVVGVFMGLCCCTLNLILNRFVNFILEWACLFAGKTWRRMDSSDGTGVVLLNSTGIFSITCFLRSGMDIATGM